MPEEIVIACLLHDVARRIAVAASKKILGSAGAGLCRRELGASQIV